LSVKNNKLAYIIIVLPAYLFAVTGIAIAEEGPVVLVPPSDRLYWALLSIIRYNPLGLETQNRLIYSKRLAVSFSLLFRGIFLALGLLVKLKPAFIKAGGLVDFQPIAIFNLRLGYEFINYFSTLGYLQLSPLSDADYDDDTMEKTKRTPTLRRGIIIQNKASGTVS
jgi:hypothetical protein